jgi:c(7)-type cytochrome triheme protein
MKNARNTRLIQWIMKVPSVELGPVLNRLKGLKRTTLIIALALVAVPGILLSLGFVHLVGTQKLYCLNCHINQKDQNFWAKSEGHPDINCATCHDEGEGSVVYSAFHFKFSAKDDVVNHKCIGCHKDDLSMPVGIDASDKTRPDNELVRIPHSMHVEELGIKCTFCHANIFHERRSAELATYRPKMGTCYNCHDEAGTSCDTCHPNGTPIPASLISETGGGKIRFYPVGYGPVTFEHTSHVEAGLGCDACHPALFDPDSTDLEPVTMSRIFSGKQCGACHNGQEAFSANECARCHLKSASGGELAYSGGGAGKVVFSHDNHIGMGFMCTDCHSGNFGFKKSGKMSMDAMYGGRQCGSCHDGNSAFSASESCDGCHDMG